MTLDCVRLTQSGVIQIIHCLSKVFFVSFTKTFVFLLSLYVYIYLYFTR